MRCALRKSFIGHAQCVVVNVRKSVGRSQFIIKFRENRTYSHRGVSCKKSFVPCPCLSGNETVSRQTWRRNEICFRMNKTKKISGNFEIEEQKFLSHRNENNASATFR